MVTENLKELVAVEMKEGEIQWEVQWLIHALMAVTFRMNHNKHGVLARLKTLVNSRVRKHHTTLLLWLRHFLKHIATRDISI